MRPHEVERQIANAIAPPADAAAELVAVDPAYQLFLLAHGHATQITHVNVFWEGVGLETVAASADGTRLAASRFGEDTNQAWIVNLITHQLHELSSSLTADGISRNGQRLLLESMYGLIWSPTTSKIETTPFTGGRPTILVSPGGQASWNQ